MPGDGITTIGITTIKVSKELRARISGVAAEEGLTAAELIARLLDAHERRRRFRAVRDAYARLDPGYRVEIDHWDALADDGLE